MTETSDEETGKLAIFVSHKNVDHGIASQMVELLRQEGSERVEIISFLDGSHHGKNYREWIEGNLDRANWYILIFTDPYENWDWCLYEAGYFKAQKFGTDAESGEADEGDPNRLLCFHPGKRVPSPLEGFHTVSVQTDSTALEQFCEQFLDHARPDLGSKARASKVENLKEGICNAFSFVPNRFYSKYIEIVTGDPREIDPPVLPDDAIVRGGDMMQYLFGVESGEYTWGDLVQNQPPGDPRWQTQLVQSLKNVLSTGVAVPISGRVKCVGTSYNARPALIQVDQLSDGSYRSELHFVWEVGEEWANRCAKWVHVLLASINMTIRMRYEFIDKYANNVIFAISEEGNQIFRKRVRNLLFDIYKEGEYRGVTNRQMLLQAFEDEGVRNHVAAYFDRWQTDIAPRLFQALGISIEPTEWREPTETDFEDAEVQEIESCLSELREISTEYLRIAMHRYADLVSANQA